MIITGIAHPPLRLHEKAATPSPELVYLAKRGLKEYEATHLITSLSPGWDQALAKAAIELSIPYTVAIPFPGRDAEWGREIRVQYLDLLARAAAVYRVSDSYSENALLESHLWRTDEADLLLALWEYEFSGEVFKVMDKALKCGKPVVNLWEDWSHLYTLRKRNAENPPPGHKRGAQVYGSKNEL